MKNLSYEIKITLLIVLIGISIIILSVFLNKKINNLNTLQKTQVNIQKLHSSMLMLRRLEKDFLLRKDIKYEFMHEEELTFIRTLSDKIIKDLKQNNINAKIIEEFIISIEIYENHFHELVHKKIEIGLDENKGLYAALRDSIHMVEEEALKLNNKELIYKIYDLRKQEKDFMLRKNMKYVDNFKEKINSLLKSLGLNENLQKYNKDFLSLVKIQNEIGLTHSLGLRGEMRKNVHRSEELIKEVSQKIGKNITKEIDILNRYIFLIILFMFLLSGLIIFLILKRTTHKLELLKDALADANSRLEDRVKAEVKLSQIKDKKALEQAKKAKKALNKSLEVFGENVIASDADTKGIITYVSAALCKTSGFSSDELIGKPHSKLRHPDTPKKLFEEMWHNLKEEKMWEGEIKNLKKDGGFYWVRSTIYPKYNENKQLIGYSSIRQDITPQKAKEEFMANMSHELRTPLNSIIGFSGILHKKLKVTKNKELIEQVESSSKHLLSLINDILDLSKMNTSEFKIEPHEFNGYEEIISFSKRFDGLSKKGLICITSVDDSLKAIFMGDWLRLSQIVLNLISNSIKFTDVDGRVEFNVEYVDGCILFRVSDNGIGMTQEAQNKIFKPFVQADGSTTRKYGGTGLGLSITQKLVEAMDGKIELESKEGVGTTFTVTIPLEKVSDEVATTEIIQEQQEQKTNLNGHILVVEDNKTNQMLLRMLLEDFNITCDIANDGLEAVDIYNPKVHKLILMDENMPNMNGIEAMKIIKENHKDNCTPIIALTANSMAGDRERFLAEGMDGYLSKPIDEAKLYEILKEFL